MQACVRRVCASGERQADAKQKKNTVDLPLSLEVYLVAVAFNTLAARVPAVVALVDVELLFAAGGGSAAVLLVDTDVFFETALLATGCFGGRGASFVTFPSDARSLIREADFALYLDV